jgi:hypothetical protein
MPACVGMAWCGCSQFQTDHALQRGVVVAGGQQQACSPQTPGARVFQGLLHSASVFVGCLIQLPDAALLPCGAEERAVSRVCGAVLLINGTCHRSGCILVQDEETCGSSAQPAACDWYAGMHSSVPAPERVRHFPPNTQLHQLCVDTRRKKVLTQVPYQGGQPLHAVLFCEQLRWAGMLAVDAQRHCHSACLCLVTAAVNFIG